MARPFGSDRFRVVRARLSARVRNTFTFGLRFSSRKPRRAAPPSRAVRIRVTGCCRWAAALCGFWAAVSRVSRREFGSAKLLSLGLLTPNLDVVVASTANQDRGAAWVSAKVSASDQRVRTSRPKDDLARIRAERRAPTTLKRWLLLAEPFAEARAAPRSTSQLALPQQPPKHCCASGVVIAQPLR